MASRLSRFIRALITGDKSNLPSAKTDIERALLEGVNTDFGRGGGIDGVTVVNMTYTGGKYYSDIKPSAVLSATRKNGGRGETCICIFNGKIYTAHEYTEDMIELSCLYMNNSQLYYSYFRVSNFSTNEWTKGSNSYALS